MEDKRNLHLKVQELIDCYLNNDPLKEMSAIGQEADPQEAALKWLALASLHAIGAGAKKITLKVDDQKGVKVTAQYHEAVLPTPNADLARRIVDTMRSITHIEGQKGKTPLALGVRNDNIEVSVKVKTKDTGTKLSLEFS